MQGDFPNIENQLHMQVNITEMSFLKILLKKECA